MSEFRRYGRKPLRYAVKVSHTTAGDILAETQDISDSGIFVRSADLLKWLSIGEKVNACLKCDQNTVENTQLKVVRITDEGVGLVFD